MRIRELTRIGIVVVAGATLGVSGVAQVRDMSLETHIQELTGPSAADCGTHSRLQSFRTSCASRSLVRAGPSITVGLSESSSEIRVLKSRLD